MRIVSARRGFLDQYLPQQYRDIRLRKENISAWVKYPHAQENILCPGEIRFRQKGSNRNRILHRLRNRRMTCFFETVAAGRRCFDLLGLNPVLKAAAVVFGGLRAARCCQRRKALTAQKQRGHENQDTCLLQGHLLRRPFSRLHITPKTEKKPISATGSPTGHGLAMVFRGILF